MEKINISTKKRVTIVILGILCTLAIRFNTKPKIYSGFIFALIGILFVGFNTSNKYLGGLLGGLVAGAGLLIRRFFPQAITLEGDKLAKFMVEHDQYAEFIGKYFILMILAGVIVGFLGGGIGKIFDEERSGKFSTHRITYIAIFVAMSVAINTARVGSISFGGFPIILSGYFLGPINGFIVGALADVVGFLIRPSSTGGFNIAFVLTSALTGFIPVLVTRLLGEKYPNYSFIKVLIGVFVGQMITSVLMVPFFMVIFYGKNTFIYYAGKAFIKQIISIPVYAFLINTVSDSIGRTVDFAKAR